MIKGRRGKLAVWEISRVSMEAWMVVKVEGKKRTVQ